MQEVFTKHTKDEVAFLVDELALPKGGHILDVGCGTGRHAIELAKLGYQITGIDISTGMLAEAEKAASQVDVEVNWVRADATEFQPTDPADAAICLCDGAFGLIGTSGETLTHEREILDSISKSLDVGGKLILNAPNGLAKIRSATPKQVASGEFDPLTITDTFQVELEDQGAASRLNVHERGFVPSELRLLLEISGFDVEGVYGGTAGAWNREGISLDEVEIMVIAHKRQ